MTGVSKAAAVVRTEMYRCGYTISALSESTGISQAVLRGILSGRSDSISTRNIMALAKAFDYSMTDFIDLISDTKES